MKIVTAICAEVVLQDITSGSVSLINVMQEIKTVGLPVMVPKISFFAIIERGEEEPNELEASLSVQLNGAELTNQKGPITFQDRLIARHTVAFFGLPVFSTGILKFVFNIGGAEASCSIPVQQVQIPFEGIRTENISQMAERAAAGAK